MIGWDAGRARPLLDRLRNDLCWRLPSQQSSQLVGSYWSFYGGNTLGITLLPMLIGVGVLFWNWRNLAGWLLTIAGALFILAGLIANMHIYFRPTSLFNTLVMLILFVGGLGFMARALRSCRGQNIE
jgi:hypothetical protein